MTNQLRLKYDFTSRPNPIRASVGGANANQIDLHVIVTNPSLDPLKIVTAITILIPVGSEAGGTLSAGPNLPSPQYDTNSGWTVGVAGGTLTLTPPADGITNSFLFKLPGIEINNTFGVVPLTITELDPRKITDDTTYKLVKLEADFPVTDFSATPATLDDLDRTVMLHWECSDQGRKFVYSVHSDSWHPNDCLNNVNQCLTCANGKPGVRSPRLQQTTTFALDVIQTNPNGSRSVYKTIPTTVRVSVPSISGNSYQTTFCSGRIVRLHWIATDAAYCTVLLDGEVIDDRAPTDTYEQGYWVTNIINQTGRHQLSVTAHAASGRAQANHNFQPLTINPPIKIGQGASSIACTPDGKLAVAFTTDGMSTSTVSIIEVASGKVIGDPIKIGRRGYDIAVTPDGTLAFLAADDGVVGIEVASRKVGDPIDIGGGAYGVAFTPDGTLALVTAGLVVPQRGYYLPFVSVINVASRKVVGDPIKVGKGPGGIAITPDGKLAFVANRIDHTVSAIEIASRKVVGDPIKVGTDPYTIAVTPDGKLAVAANYRDHTVSVIDVASRKVVGDPIKVGHYPYGIAFLPDSNLALVAHPSDVSTITVVDITRGRVIGEVDAGSTLGCVAVTPDGQHVIAGAQNIVLII